MGSYEVLETMTVADCALAIDAASLADLFETAARALAELMVDPGTVRPSVVRVVTLEAPSLDLLLFDWLAELIFLKDSERLAVTRVAAKVETGSVCRLRAECVGGIIERGHTTLRADAKAVTFHQFTLEPRGAGWHARLVIDI
jgi:SHS2 domain-containing protein